MAVLTFDLPFLRPTGFTVLNQFYQFTALVACAILSDGVNFRDAQMWRIRNVFFGIDTNGNGRPGGSPLSSYHFYALSQLLILPLPILLGFRPWVLTFSQLLRPIRYCQFYQFVAPVGIAIFTARINSRKTGRSAKMETKVKPPSAQTDRRWESGKINNCDKRRTGRNSKGGRQGARRHSYRFAAPAGYATSGWSEN